MTRSFYISVAGLSCICFTLLFFTVERISGDSNSITTLSIDRGVLAYARMWKVPATSPVVSSVILNTGWGRPSLKWKPIYRNEEGLYVLSLPLVHYAIALLAFYVILRVYKYINTPYSTFQCRFCGYQIDDLFTCPECGKSKYLPLSVPETPSAIQNGFKPPSDSDDGGLRPSPRG